MRLVPESFWSQWDTNISLCQRESLAVELEKVQGLKWSSLFEIETQIKKFHDMAKDPVYISVCSVRETKAFRLPKSLIM